MEAEKKSTSPWVFIGVGCLLAVFGFIAIVVAIGAWGYSQIRELERTMEDPVARTELATEFLRTDALPDGYHAVMAMSVPFVMETTILTDREPDGDGQIRGLGERGFIYVKMLSFGEQEQELRDFFEGRSNDTQFLEQSSSLRVDTDELIDRGVIEEDTRTLRWVTYRGEIRSGPGTLGDGTPGGLNSIIMIECPAAERLRMGIWYGPDPSPDTAVEATDFTGTVADESTIQSFMAGFDVCSR